MSAELIDDRYHVPMPDHMPVYGTGLQMAILRIPWRERKRLGRDIEWRFMAEYRKKGQRYFILKAESKDVAA